MFIGLPTLAGGYRRKWTLGCRGGSCQCLRHGANDVQIQEIDGLEATRQICMFDGKKVCRFWRSLLMLLKTIEKLAIQPAEPGK